MIRGSGDGTEPLDGLDALNGSGRAWDYPGGERAAQGHGHGDRGSRNGDGIGGSAGEDAPRRGRWADWTGQDRQSTRRPSEPRRAAQGAAEGDSTAADADGAQSGTEHATAPIRYHINMYAPPRAERRSVENRAFHGIRKKFEKNQKKGLTYEAPHGKMLTDEAPHQYQPHRDRPQSRKGQRTMKYYNVTFKWYDTDTYCANIAKAESAEDVKAHYAKYDSAPIITEASTYDVTAAQERGKPIVTCPHIENEPAEATEDTTTDSADTESESAAESATPYTITHNPDFNSLEVSFTGKPSEDVRAALKALRFRWHGQRRIWYGYATEEAVRAAIDGKKKTDAAQSAEKPAKAAKKATKGTEQGHLRIYWNGIKIDGGKLIRCGYSIDNNADHEPSVSIYARHYDNLPRDLFEVKNDSDLYTDYFEKDRAYLTPAHPLYKFFRYAAEKAQARQDRPYCERLRDTLNSGKPEPWKGHYDALRADLARREAFLSQFDKATDPGQPTAEDLAEIDRQRQEAENARRAAEHEEELREREAYLNQRVNGQRLIESERTAHPVEDGKPAVCINWSEHPAFCDFEDNALLLSVTAAENILRQLDEDQHNTRETSYGRGWYYKTKFTITGTDDSGEAFTYTGRYDLGDGDGGLVSHIRAFGEWQLTRDEFGKIKPQPDETNDTIRFADFLAGFVA